jgi:ribonucleoside-diphosphate reductase alpha chain
MAIKKVKKRDGRIVDFDQSRITNAIYKALFDAKISDGRAAKKLSDRVVKILEEKFARNTPSVENIQDNVESVLSAWNKKAADVYSEYRKKMAQLRKERKKYGMEGKLTYNAITVLKERYLLKNEKGEIIETPEEMFRRVAKTVAKPEQNYGGKSKKIEEEFFQIMSRLEFVPNSPTMFNAGAPLKQLSACFVLPVEDSLESIFSQVKNTAIIEQAGGGVGYSFSRLRPKGDIVRSTKGIASGPVSFMSVFDVATEVIKAGGKRRGALMGILRCDHPDIMEFVKIKQNPKMLSNFNISVAATDSFMKAAQANKEYELINPRTGKAASRLNAKKVWNKIIENAWKTGDPGAVFIDEINRKNPTRHIGLIESTNPCAEVVLHPYESCNLGSISLPKMLKKSGKKYSIGWDKLRKTTRLAVRFLDNVIDANVYPLPEIEKATKANRRIGLGIMGFADMLILLGIRYDSNEALKTGEKIMKFIADESHKMSAELGKQRGSFPNFKGSKWDKKGYRSMRNATTTVIAPTGTISIIAGVSSGIEPLFALSFVRNVLSGRSLLEINSIFEQIAKERAFYSIELMMKIAKKGSVQGMKQIPKDVQKLFITALDIKPEWHVKIQAAFQKYTDNAVSKTINFPEDAKMSDVKKAYELAYKLKCKGITVYRYGSKPEQVLYIGKKELLHAEAEFAGGCPTKLCPMPD